MAAQPPLPATNSLLSIRSISVRFGGILALDGISFEIAKGSIVGLIGPNGAGKTTLFNCLSRLYTPCSGDIVLADASILQEPVHRMAWLGVGRTFQNLALFRNMSVRDNVRIGCHVRTRSDYLSDILNLGRARRANRDASDAADTVIAELGLAAVALRPVGELPFGTQKRVELARALAARPRLLLLDEPACGLNHEEVEELGTEFRRLRDEQAITILLVEHHMGLVMSASDKVVAMNFGRRIAEGSPTAIQNDPAVIEAYLGQQAPA